MKVDFNNGKAVIARLVSYWFQTIIVNYNLTRRSAVLLLMTALLMPIFYFADWRKASAQSLSASLSASTIKAFTALPEQFYYPASDGIQAATASAFSSLSTLAVNVSAPVVNFFMPPKPPMGFEMAKTVSPAAKMLSSLTSRVTSFFGFFAPSSANKEENTEAESASANIVLNQPAANVDFDFDGDGKGDVSRFHPATGEWKVLQSSDGSLVTATVGSSSSIITPGDFDGDGRTDYGVFTAGSWTIRLSGSVTNQTPITFGSAGDKPVVGDYNDDGISDLAYYRPSNNTWNIRSSASGNPVTSTTFGAPGDVTVQADYDGDEKTDIAVFRPSTGDWHVLKSGSGYWTIHYGVSSDVPVPADYDADGKTDIAVFRGSTGAWFILKSSDGVTLYPVWGNYGDQPVPADYDGDGQADVGVYRPSNGSWHIYKTGSGYYSYSLGLPDDIAVPSAYIRQIGSEIHSYDFAKTRLSPKNATGGTDPYSRNFSWGTSLVNLPGRAGLDAALGISYNSLVWTKHNDMMVFDGDTSNVSPGFRLGFPTIEPGYYDSVSGKFNYLMVTPSGARVEFKQTTASDVYVTADSSYSLLKLNGTGDPNSPPMNLSITVTTTDGTQMSYSWIAGAYRCTKIMDRNGNFITIANHPEYGVLQTITDTLGRVLYVNYDSELSPTSITQWWQADNGLGAAQGHTYATFNYTTVPVNPNFSTSGVYGPSGNIKGLQSIVYSDGSSTRFTYNSFGQVYQVNNHAPDGHKLNHTAVNLAMTLGSTHSPITTAQSDCPRFGETRSYAEYFNNNAEVVVTNSAPTAATVPGTTDPASKIQVSVTGHPNSLISKMYVGSSGWKEGLTLATEDCLSETCSGTDRKRWTQTNWKQDNENLSYILNPRVSETKVGDETNTKRTEIFYRMQPNSQTVSDFGLVSAVNTYDTAQATILKRTEIDYKLDPVYTSELHRTYVSKRIIGLQSEVRVFGRENSVLNLVSRVKYEYDEGNFSDSALQQNISSGPGISPVIQHDNADYGSLFIIGRGNLTSTTRYNVEAETDFLTTSVKYNTAGAPVAQISPGSGINPTRTVTISYADKFNDGGDSRNTYAYPTKITDPAGKFSQVKYRYDFGANVWAKSPTPHGPAFPANTKGKETERKFYDLTGQLEKETIINTGAYTRYQYIDNGMQTKVFATITDGLGETESESWTDGAGRVRKTKTEHPGSLSGWSGSLFEYDILGRVTASTVPTEINANYQPAGDDAGYIKTHQKYDWKGRVIRRINTDGIDSPTLNDSDELFSYEGCGCAGGQVTTIQSASVPRDDQPTTNARRTQKITEDILGRTVKTEVMNWNGTTPYSTTINTFNGRDQITNTRQYVGTDNPNNAFQDVTITYDGHGRIKTRHYPIEDTNSNTTWYYNADDSIQQVADPRGATTNFTYNDARGLLTNITYSSPNTTQIPIPPSVSFGYDDAGNRISMTDGTGSAAYTYDSLSRMISETKTFTGLTGNFTIDYSYHMGGGLKSITDPFSSTVNYTNDKTGRLTAVSGTAFGNNTTGNYADNIKYRAFGAIKQMTYKTDDNALVSMQYDNRLRVSEYEVASSAVTGGFAQKSNYEYFADSRPKAVDNALDAGFDRTFKYDFDGRLTNNQFGVSTRQDNQQFTTYSQTVAYDAFSNMTSRQTGIWSGSESFTATYTNGRRQAATGESLTYDALGNMLEITYTVGRTRYERNKFDAAGRMAEFSTRQQFGGGQSTYYDITKITTQSYDGDGERVKQVERDERTQSPSGGVPQPVITEQAKYYARSSVTGKIITEIDSAGNKSKTNVYVGNAVLAEQRIYPTTQQTPGSSEVIWQHGDPVTGSVQQTLKTGALALYVAPQSRRELEPLGGIVPTHDPYYTQEIDEPSYNLGGDTSRPEFGCTMPDTGQPAPCNVVAFAANLGLLGPDYTVTWNTGGYSPQLPRDFIGADNRYNDSSGEENYEAIGLRRVPTYFVGSGESARAFNWAAGFNSPAAQTQQPAPLTGKDRKTFEEKQRKAQERLNAKDCKKFLERIKSYASIEDIEKQIYTHPAFSAKDTMNLKVRDSGIFSSEQIREIENAPNNPGNNAARTSLNVSVAVYFATARANAITNQDPNKPGVYYYKGYDSQTVLHESIHFATGLNDVDLANALGLKLDGKSFVKGQRDAASYAIKNALNQECR